MPKTEIDPAKRDSADRRGLEDSHEDDVGYIPLHHQLIPWAMRYEGDIDRVPPRRQLHMLER